MAFEYDKLKQRTRLLVDEALNAVKAGFSDDDANLRPLELTQLEQRILMSASPMAVVAEAVDTAAPEAPASDEFVADAPVEQTDFEQSSVQQNNAAVQSTVELVVIDPSAENYEQLVADIQSQTDREFEILILNPREDGIAQITDALQELRDVSAIHLVSHGDEGEVLLGASVLSQRTIGRYAAELVTWQQSMTADADLLIYGCDLTASADGIELTESLNTLLGADIAASDDLTGHASLGGDWELETTVGSIESALAFTVDVQQQWNGLLTTGGAAALDGLIISTSGTVDSPSGAPGLDSWDDGAALKFGGANLDLGSGTTAGSFSQQFDLSDFVDDGNADIDGLHYVSRDIMVGGAGGIQLLAGDILFSTEGTEDVNGGALRFRTEDVGLFRPDTVGDLTSGTVSMLLEDLSIKTGVFLGPAVHGFTLIEQTTTVGDVTLQAGDFLYTNLNDFQTDNIMLFETATVGDGNTSGTRSTLLNGVDVGFSVGAFLFGIELIETDTTIGGTTLSSGTILVQSSGNQTGIGSSNISSSATDIVALELTATEIGSGGGAGDASIFFRGSDVGLDSGPETIDAIALSLNHVPSLDTGGTYTISEGESLVLDASGSSDVDSDTLSYRWDLDNNGVFGEANEPVTATATVDWATLQSFGIDDDGAYTIGLQVDDGKGGVSTATAAITVNSSSPVLSTTGTGSVGTGSVYTLNLASTDAGNDTITSWTINWGDGTIDTIAGNPSTATHTYSGAGHTYNILASATDEDGTWIQNELIAPSYNGDTVFRFAATTGDFLQKFATNQDTDAPIAAIIGPDGLLYVSSETSNDVLRYNAETGAFIDVFIAPGTGGLQEAEGIAFGPDGHLYVADYSGDRVRRFDGTTGAFIDNFVTNGSGGLKDPYALVFGPDGDLYVNSFTEANVLRFDGKTGASIDTFVANGLGGLSTPEAMVFGPDGNLYVASADTDNVLRYSGTTGVFIDSFVSPGSGGLNQPGGLAFGPDGNLYVGNLENGAIHRYNGTTGAYIDDYVTAGAGGFDAPSSIAFVPEHQVTVTTTPPTITSDGGGATATVNASETDPAVTTVTVTDPDVPFQTLSYSLSGTDAARFTISSTGVLTFASPQDFENPTDANTDNRYEVTVEVNDGIASDTQAITVIVSDVADDVTGELWFTTDGNGSATGESWTNAEVVQFGNSPDRFDLATGTTDGSFSKLPGFVAPSNINALHYVETNLQIGNAPNDFDLKTGDLILVLDSVTLNTADGDAGNDFAVDRQDIVVYRPDATSDYSSGEYQMLLDSQVSDATKTLNIHALALVETDTTVGGTTLVAGTLVVAHNNPNHQDVSTIAITGTGANSAATQVETLLTGASLGNSGNKIQGLHLLQQETEFSGTLLSAGTLLVQIDATDTLAGASYDRFSVIALEVTQTEQDVVPGTAATGAILFNGSDVELGAGGELLNGFTVVSSSFPGVNSAPTLNVASDFTLDGINENETDSQGTLVSMLMDSVAGAASDADGDSVGIAVTSVDDTNGTWEYSTNGGASWTPFGAVTQNSAVVLGAGSQDRVRFIPNLNVAGSESFTFRAWDGSDGNTSGSTGVNASVIGGGTAFSTNTGTATVPIVSVNVVLNFATVGDVTDSGGAPGLNSWTNSEIIVLGDPNFAFEPGTSGTLFKTYDLNDYTGGTDISIEAIHEVSTNITVGGVNGTVDLVAGDILFAAPNNSVTYTGLDAVDVAAGKRDIVRFRPSDQTFALVFDEIGSPFVNGFTLVEKDVAVGDTDLSRGDVLLNIGNNKDILLVEVTGAGVGNAVGTSSVLIAGDDIGMGGGVVNIAGIDLIEEDINPGGFALRAGQIVATLDGDDTDVGNNNITVLASDIFLLDVTTTSLGPTNTTAATATIMMEGADLNLESSAELLTALSYTINFGVRDEPVLSFVGANPLFTEGDSPVLIDSTATVTDVDSANFDGGILRVELTNNGTADDRISIRNQGTAANEIGVVGANLTFEGVQIGVFTGGEGTDPLVVSLTANASEASVSALLQNFEFSNVSANPFTGDRAIRFSMTDGDGSASDNYFKNVSVQSVNEIPTAVTGNYSITEGSALTLDATSSSDPDGDLLTYEWDLDYDGTFASDLTGENPTVNWSTLFDNGIRTGNYTIAVRVSDGSLTSPIATSTLSVTSLPATSITQTTTTINIDGNIDAAWAESTSVGLTRAFGTVDNPADLSADWRSAWDADNLYFLVDVEDETIVTDSGAQAWDDDVVVLYIDADNSRRGTYDSNDFEFAFRVDDPSTVHVGLNSVNDSTGVQFTILKNGSGYVAEISVPWTTLGVTPAAGNNLGFEVHVGDDDDGGGRDTTFVWSDLGTVAFNDTSAFGKVELVAATTSTIVVDTTSDTADAIDGDTSSIAALYADKGTDGKISLREAILAANASANSGTPDRILFEITDPLASGGHTINLTSALPDIDQQLIIDGTTEGDFAGSPVIVLDGSAAGSNAHGLRLIAGSDGSTVRGLAINQFAQDGIRVDGSGSHTIVGNYLGTDAGGVTDLGNGRDGIFLSDSNGNTIGTSVVADRNVIVGNVRDGVRLSNSDSNVIRGNYVGLAADGVQNAGHDDDGIHLSGTSSANIIGGSGLGDGNVIVSNSNNGIEFGGTVANNIVIGNYIGLTSGGAALGNSSAGIRFHSDSTSNSIGGINSGEGNQIANNAGYGISTSGNAALPTANIQIVGNAIFANGGLGIDVEQNGVTIQTEMPDITSAEVDGTNLTVSGSVTGTAGATYQLAFYASASEDATGHGEAERFLGTIDVTIDVGGTATSFSETLTGAGVSIGEFVTATARTNGSSTTEFAANVQAVATNVAPTASIATVATIAEGDGLSLDGTGSTDPDGQDLNYEWDIAYDGTFTANFTTETVDLTWSQLSALGIDDDGTYDIALRVNDGGNNSQLEIVTLTVTNVDPTISITGNSEVGSGETYTVNLNYSDVGDDSVQSWIVNWGDGSIETIAGSTTTATHVYTNGGFTNNITYSVTDDDGTYHTSKLVATSSANNRVYFNDDGAESTIGIVVGPIDVVLGPDGLLYVANFGSNDIDRIDPVTGGFVDTFVIPNSGGLDSPSRIAFGPDGSLYVTSHVGGEVLRFGNDGRFLGEFITGLSRPDGIAFDGQGSVYVSDATSGEIFKYDSITGVQIGSGPFATFGKATFIDLNFGASGNLFASNTTDNLIREFDSTGTAVGDFSGGPLTDVTTTAGFSWGPDGRLYVADFGGNRVAVYQADGTFVETFATGLSSPVNLTFTSSLQVRVNDIPVVAGESFSVNEGGTLNVTGVANWANPSWKQRQQILLDNSASSVALTDVPILVKLHTSAADAINIDYANTRDGGEDLRFVDPDGTVLKHEIETWDESGYSYVWVNVPSIDASSASDFIWMYYDQELAADGHSQSDVWNSDYSAVYHLNGSSLESTSNANHGAISDVVVQPGIVGRAGDFNGTTSQINLGSDSTVDDIFAGGGTISAWVNPEGSGENGFGRILDKASTTFSAGANGDGWSFQVARLGTTDGGFLIFEHGFTGGNGDWRTPAGSISLGNWQHVAVVYDSSSNTNAPKIYIDGVLQTVTENETPSGTAKSDADLNLTIGNHSRAPTRTFDGRIDEVRIARTEISGEQFAAEFENVTGSFASASGTVESGPNGLLANDADREGDPLTVSLVSGPANANSFSLNPDGSFNYVHDGSETTNDSFTYTVNDGTTTSAPVTVSLTITPQNDAPVVSAIGSQTSPEDTTIGPLAFTVSDAETAGGALTVTATSNNQALIADSGIVLGGSGANRTITLTPVANATGGPTTITVNVSDGVTTTQTTFQVTLTPTNDAPTITPIGNVTTPEDTAVGSIAFTVQDAESAAGVLTVSAISSDQSLVKNADIVVSGTGANRTISFVPVANAFGGPATITVQVSDGVDSSTSTFDVTVTPANDPPEISAVSDVTVDEDTNVGPIDFTVSDIDNVPGDLTVTATSSDQSLVADSDITLVGTGASRTIRLSPQANASGTTTITLAVSDGGAPTFQTFDVTFDAVDDAPTIGLIPNITTAEDTISPTVLFVVGDIDSAAAAMSISAVSVNQSIVADGDLVLGGTGPNRTIRFTPAANVSGEVEIVVTLSDGNTSVDRVFKAIVTPVNDLPTISSIANQTIDEDTPSASLPFTVGDIESSAGALTVTATSDNQSIIADGDIVLTGTGANRSVQFTSVKDANGGPVRITLTVSDGTATSTEFFDVTVNSVNDRPEIDSIPDVATLEDTVTGTFTFGVSDAETAAGTLVVSAVSSDQSLVADAGITLGGTGANRTISISPVANANGGPATITVSVSDGTNVSTETFRIRVTPVNDAPTVSVIPNVTTPEDTAVGPFNFTISDIDNAAGDLTITATSDDQSLVRDADIVLGGTGANRSISLTPAPNANGGPATITVRVSDGTTATTQTFEVTVTPVNDAPTVATIPDVTIAEDTTAGPYTFVIGDVDNDAAGLTVTATSSNPGLITDAGIVLSGTGANRTITVTPLANASGTATITVVVSDGLQSTASTFDVTVTPVNDAPTVATIPDVTIAEDTTAGPYTFVIGDIDNDAAGLTVTATSSNPGLIADAGIVLSGTGANRTITVTPLANANGTATITVVVSDGIQSVPSTFDVTVTPVNDAPTVATIPDVTIAEDTTAGPYTFVIGDIDNDAAGLTVTATSSNPGLIADAGIVLSGAGANRTITVTPLANASGTATITVAVSDGLQSVASTFEVTVTPVNDAPEIAVIPDATTPEDTDIGPYTFSIGDVESAATDLVLAATSSDQDIVADSSITLGGTTGNRTISISPNRNAFGTVTITLTVSDGVTTTPRTFDLIVTAVNDAPVISAIADMTIDEDAFTGPLAFTVRDIDDLNRTLTVTATSSNQDLIADGDISFTGTGTNRNLIFKPVKDQFGGPVIISLVVSDGEFDVPTDFVVNIRPVNDAPEFAPGTKHSYLVDDDFTLELSDPVLLDGVTDVENDQVTAVLVTGPAHGELTLKEDGSFTYVADVGSPGVDFFEFNVTDGKANSRTERVSLVLPVTVPLPIPTNPTGPTSIPESNPEPESPDDSSESPSDEAEPEEAVEPTPELLPAAAKPEDSSNSEDEDFIPPPVVQDDDEEAAAIYNPVRVSDDNGRVSVTSGSSIDVADADRVLANVLGFDASAAGSAEALGVGVQSGNAVFFTSVNYESFSEVKGAVDQIEHLKETLDSRIDLSGVAVNTVAATGTAVVVSAVVTAIRTGVLALGFLTQLPIWTMFDPLMVMDGASGEEGDSLQEIVDRNAREAEKSKAQEDSKDG